MKPSSAESASCTRDAFRLLARPYGHLWNIIA